METNYVAVNNHKLQLKKKKKTRSEKNFFFFHITNQ